VVQLQKKILDQLWMRFGRPFPTSARATNPVLSRIIRKRLQFGDSMLDGSSTAAQDRSHVLNSSVTKFGRFYGGITTPIFLRQRSVERLHVRFGGLVELLGENKSHPWPPS
jgi:hypothetical protein